LGVIHVFRSDARSPLFGVLAFEVILGVVESHHFQEAVAVAIRRRTKDHFKGQYAKKRGSGIAPENLDDAQPASAERSTGGQADMEWQVLKRELEAKLVELGFSDKERTIFGLYYFQGFTAIQISKFPWVGLSVKGVESLIHRMTQALRDFFGEHEGL
jgi:DNA-directed RNA polymerase specialized sigma24 family protein